jgi:hypothetical protein
LFCLLRHPLIIAPIGAQRQALLTERLRLFGILFRIFAVLCTQQRCSRVDGHTFGEGFPEPEHAVGDRDLRRCYQASTLQIEQPITPRSGALADAICETDKFLLAFRRRAR